MVKGFHVVSMVTERKNNINMKLCKLTFPFHCDALQVLKYLRFFIWTFPWESYERFSPSAFLLSLLPSIPKILFLSTFFAYFWSFQPLLFSSASYFSYFTLISLISILPTSCSVSPEVSLPPVLSPFLVLLLIILKETWWDEVKRLSIHSWASGQWEKVG